MNHAEYIKSCSEYGMAKEILKIARQTCKWCRETCCEGVENCERFSDRYGASGLAEWLQEDRDVRSQKSE